MYCTAQEDSISAVAGWFGNLATTVADSIDQVAHLGDQDGGAAASQQPPASVSSGGGGGGVGSGGGGGGKTARQRSVHEQRAFEIKVSSEDISDGNMQTAPIRAAGNFNTRPFHG